MEKKFYKIKSDRKYASFVDEYRRYYVSGRSFRIKGAKGKNMGDQIFEFCVSQITKPIWKAKISKKIDYNEFFDGMKIGSSKYRKNIVISEFVINRKFSLEYSDERKNLYRITIEVKSNDTNKFKYSEWIKKDKPFFGLNDTVGKIFMRRAIKRKVNVLSYKINKHFFGIENKIKNQNEKRDFKKSIKIQNRGLIQRRELGYKDDFGGILDKNVEAPDRPSSYEKEEK